MTIILTLLLSALPATALIVITTQSPVISVLALVLFTSFLACSLFIQGFAFVSILYVVVYVGAVAILFIFVIMMIDVRDAEITSTGLSYTKNLPLSFTLATLAFSTLSSVAILHPTVLTLPFHLTLQSDMQALASALYGYSAFHLILLSLLLLTAKIGPITLCIHAKNAH